MRCKMVMDIYKAIRNGQYESKVPYPRSKPKKPVTLVGYDEAQILIEKEWTFKIELYNEATRDLTRMGIIHTGRINKESFKGGSNES